MTAQRIILLSSGSFNPPTIMHLRIFELARDYLHKTGKFQVIGGILSPVHDDYGKKELASSSHRIEMGKLALSNHPWVKLSRWEALENSNWTRTRAVMDYHQGRIDAYLNGNGSPTELKKEDWFPESLTKGEDTTPVRCKLLCGADVLQSFTTPFLWEDDDITTLTRDYGLVVISREGSDPQKSIYDSDILHANQGCIILVREWLSNEISSTRIRRAIRRQESIQYMVPDPVIDYIHKKQIYL